MMLFRRAYPEDLDAIHQLAQESGIGITTLSKDKQILAQRLAWSCASFAKKPDKAENEFYLFVLIDCEKQRLVGTAAIEAATGYSAPFYSYKLSKRTRICHDLDIRCDYEVLTLVNDNQGKTEICTLYLHPDYRVNGNGFLLSRARFLFIAENRQRFADTIIAEMRGVSDESGQSPFWDHIGAHFFHMPFAEADRLTLSTNKQFIADLMPRNSLYVRLLHEDAQAVIGQPHPSSVAAMKILAHEGFRYNNYIDIFDGGPTIEAPTKDIYTIKNSKITKVTNISDEVSSPQYLLANATLDFHATINRVIINGANSCIINKATAALLKINVGDNLRIAPLHIQNAAPSSTPGIT